MPIEPWQEISLIGRKLVERGLTSSRFGNISLRDGQRIQITCTGSMLDEIDSHQVVEVDLKNGCAAASSETCVHQAIYRCSDARAIIHTHSPYAVTLSLIETNVVMPIDSEGITFLGEMPIVEGRFGSLELADSVSLALRDHKACIARGHGVFVAGKDLLEAYTAASMAEHSSQVSYLVKVFRGR
jgi:L-fuculose-phosphate aldolase